MTDRDLMADNLAWWNERVPAHAAGEFYDVASFLGGTPKPMKLEREELGNVEGKSLLHLQCHFGMDTLSWAMAGADVTGIDFSDVAIKTAQKLSRDAGLESRFIQSNIYDLPKNLEEQFDVVFTSWGVLAWLPDHKRWAEIAARYVKPGGTFYILEFHPFTWVFDETADADRMRDERILPVKYDYFGDPSKPLSDDTPEEGSYGAPDHDFKNHKTNEWQFDLGRIVTNLIEAGLQIEFVREHPISACASLPFLEDHGGDRWLLPEGWPQLPLSFSIRATKPQ